DKHSVTFFDEPTQPAVLRLQIEDVVLVDPGRYEQHRRLENRVRERRVLDQLDEAVAEDDLAGGQREITANRKCSWIALGDRKEAAPLLQIVHKVVQSTH